MRSTICRLSASPGRPPSRNSRFVSGGDDVGWIRDHQVEPSFRDWLEPAPLAPADVADAVQGRVQLSECDRSRVRVDGLDLGRMPGSEQRMDAGAGPEIERRA